MIDYNSMDSNDIELMDEYFDSRVDVYDTIHQQTGISWGIQIRDIVSNYISIQKANILDLGCGTGLELEKIFEKNPQSSITCVDLSSKMLEELKKKYDKYKIHIINDNFFNINFGIEEYDYVISVMALHHFFEDEKLELYRKIYSSLKKDGLFINSDYIIDDKILEQRLFNNLREIKQNNPGALFHYDIPFTEERERNVLFQSGFEDIEKVYENKKTKILVSRKNR